MTEHEISRINRDAEGNEVVLWRITGWKATAIVGVVQAFAVAGLCAVVAFALKLAGVL